MVAASAASLAIGRVRQFVEAPAQVEELIPAPMAPEPVHA
jgi:hypothetical protein